MSFGRAALSLLFVVALVCGAPPAFGDDPAPSIEYQVKASLILNFVRLTEWASDSPAVLRICMFGPDRFGAALEPWGREIVNGKRLEAVHLDAPAELSAVECAAAFFARESAGSAALAAFSGRPVLTIGETPDFLDQGGIITMLLDKNRMVFEVNREAALGSRIELSSKLLRMARRVVG